MGKIVICLIIVLWTILAFLGWVLLVDVAQRDDGVRWLPLPLAWAVVQKLKVKLLVGGIW